MLLLCWCFVWVDVDAGSSGVCSQLACWFQDFVPLVGARYDHLDWTYLLRCCAASEASYRYVLRYFCSRMIGVKMRQARNRCSTQMCCMPLTGVCRVWTYFMCINSIFLKISKNYNIGQMYFVYQNISPV